MTRLTRPAAVPLYTAAASLTLLGALTGCASATPAASTDTAPEAPITGGDYADGSYSATGTYVSPNGTETIGVQVTLEDNAITAVEVEPQPTNGTTSRYQSMFAGGIAAEVVGTSIDEAQVTRVAGSSLTGRGFADALEQIKADALAG